MITNEKYQMAKKLLDLSRNQMLEALNEYRNCGYGSDEFHIAVGKYVLYAAFREIARSVIDEFECGDTCATLDTLPTPTPIPPYNP